MRKPTPWNDLLMNGLLPNVAEDQSERLEDTIGKPRIFTVAGKDVDFFTTGQLALALGRKAVTIRKWESDGVIPVSPYASNSPDPRGRRRLYTREQVEGIVTIALEEGILQDKYSAIKKTEFTPRVIALFNYLLEDRRNEDL